MDDTGFFEEFMPHGMCYLWNPQILILNVVSDALIAIAYFCIPFALYYFFRHRVDFPFRNVILMFSIFIFTCGLSHLMGIWTVWNGAYGLQGLVKGATALASIATAAMLIPLMPQMLALRSPKDLEDANIALTEEVSERMRSETRTRRFVEGAPDAVVIVDKSGRIQVVNARAEAMFGMDRSHLIGASVDTILKDPKASKFSGILKTILSKNLKHADDVVRLMDGLRQDGSQFSSEVSLSEVGTEEQSLYSLAIRDISQRLEQERQTRALEQQIAHVDRLDTMGQMAAGLAHEINQPLTALTQNADAALMWASQQKNIASEFLEIIKDIDEQAHRAGEIIRALRQFVGKDDKSRSSFDLNSLLSQTLRLIANDAQKHDVSIETSVPNATVVVGARVQIAQVFVNLLRNSIEAMADAHTSDPKISITAKPVDDFLRLTVQDNGPGMTASNDVFTPFQSTKADGMGMGLSICRSIIEGHGGQFYIDNTVEKGAVFVFTLPLGGE